MSVGRCSRVVMIGIDGLPPWQLDKFLEAKYLPNFERLLQRGIRYDAIPTLPPLTAPGWAAIASGRSPSSLGIENILLPTPGRRPDEIRNGFDATYSNGEFLWQTLAREGRSACVIKYPGSWPPRPGNFTQIDGAGGYADIRCRFEALGSATYVAEKNSAEIFSPVLFPDGYLEHWRIHADAGDALIKIHRRDASGWSLDLANYEPVFEFVIPSQSGSIPLFALACRIAGSAHLVLARSKTGRPVAVLAVGEWSDWFEGKEPRGAFKYRYKLISLAPEQKTIHLYRSEGHLLSGFTKPAELAAEYVEAVGPPIEWTGTFDFLNGLVDLNTQAEIYRQHTDWLRKTLSWMSKQRTWHGLFFHWHALEYAHHIVGASLSTDHPLHVAENRDRDLGFLKSVYRMADDLVGTVLDIADDDTLIVLASDHGHDLVHTLFFVNHWLISKGLLSIQDGKIDWSRTIAYGLFPGCIHINDQARWSCGIVKASDVDGVAARIAREMQALVDPRTNEFVVSHALRRPELSKWGQVGERAPDVFVCLKRGYEVATRIDPKRFSTLFQLTIPYKDETSGHGSFFPESSSARTLAILAGPRAGQGVTSPSPISVLDIAPTILSSLGIAVPPEYAGRPIPMKEAQHELSN